jgi:UDP-N-acetylmuramate: L-alanyl-gamma-D-glutamyl-meso-diaminopimelate ligase
MVSLNKDSEIAIFEGDEYLSSPIDLRPKFIHYKPDITLISGIAWDHINVFPTFGEYVKQFKILTEITADKGHLVYYSNDEALQQITSSVKSSLVLHPYAEHPHKIKDRSTYLLAGNREIPIKIFGKHNLQNINGAKEVCTILGLSDDDFYKSITSFPGTSKRLQEICNEKDFCCFLDFAHAPSKVRATLQAVKEKYPDRHLTAVLELHTFSSLNKDFIPQYKGSLDLADEAVVYFDKHVLEHKKMESLSEQFVEDCFHKKELKIITNADSLANYFSGMERNNRVLLLMSSGNFGGINVRELFKSVR